MTLSIAATPHSHWHLLKPTLKVLGWPETQSDPEQWRPEAIGQGSQSVYLLLHSRPELALARALAAGEALEQAFAEWDAATDRLLAFYQGHRKQAALVDASAASTEPKALVTWLAENHPAFSDVIVPDTLEGEQGVEPPNPALLLVAAQFLNNIPDLDLKLGRLEAMSVPLNEKGYVAPEIDLVNALQHIQQSQAFEERKVTEGNATRSLEDARAENELLILQLHQVQEELEEQYLREQKLKDELISVKDALSSSESEALSLQKQLSTQKDELEMQLKNLKSHLALIQDDVQANHARANQLEAELTDKQSRIDQLQAKNSDQDRKLLWVTASHKAAVREAARFKRDLKAAEHQQHVLTNELERLKKSITWRLTSPVRAIGGVAKVAHKPTRRQIAARKHAGVIEKSSLFDPGWYLEKYPDVAKEPMSPSQHYLVYGAEEGRDPSEHFSTKWYLEKYQDVAQSGINPLLHYILYGKKEGRKPGPNVTA
ncbi:hypothetical protein [Marinimicrobium koreense]|uniref:hypothetical protein n=1 Tax=Marinimicrobium koreense TaxID=306545 RepID=UPI003F708849